MDAFPQLLASAASLGAVYAAIAAGLSLVFGTMRVINFAHAEFVMIGMYVAVFSSRVLLDRTDVSAGLLPYLTLPVSAIVAAVIGAVAARFLFARAIGLGANAQMLVAIGLIFVLQNGALLFLGGQPQALDVPAARETISILSIRLTVAQLLLIVASGVLLSGMMWMTKKTTVGLYLRAVADDRYGAASVGLPIKRIHSLSFALSCALAACAGTLLVPLFPVTPSIGSNFILIAFVAVIVGGLGSIGGAIVGALMVATVSVFVPYYGSAELVVPAYVLVFLCFLLLRPAGFFGVRGSEEVGMEGDVR